jgi:hypothetical protein
MAEFRHERAASAAVQSIISFGLMFLLIYAMVISYPKELAWLSKNTTELWKSTRTWLNSSFLANYHLGKVFLNQLRMVNGSHLIIMFGCTVLTAVVVGPFLSRKHSTIARRTITAGLTSIAGISVGTAFLLLNLSAPDTLGMMLDACEWFWHKMINFIEASLGGFDLVQGLVNFARTGINGHHMLLISIATFICGWIIRKVWDMLFARNRTVAQEPVPPPPQKPYVVPPPPQVTSPPPRRNSLQERLSRRT